MDLFQFRAFLAVANQLHFGRAAEELRIAQPALSRRIHQLENLLGARLFERSTRRVRLSPAGEALFRHAELIVKEVALAERSVAEVGNGEAGRVRLAFAGPSTQVMASRLTKAVHQSHPSIDFKVRSTRFSIPALHKVLEDELEICLGLWRDIPPGISTRVLANEYLVVAVPGGHRLAGAKDVSMKEIRRESFVSLPHESGSILDERLRFLAFAAGFSPKIVQEAPDTWTLMSLVAADIGCSLALSSVAEKIKPSNVDFLRLRDPSEPIQLRIAWRTNNQSPSLKVVLELAEKLLPTPSVDDEI